MKAGVSTLPCASVNVALRAAPSAALIVNCMERARIACDLRRIVETIVALSSPSARDSVTPSGTTPGRNADGLPLRFAREHRARGRAGRLDGVRAGRHA